MPITKEIIREFNYKTSRSGGKGGQHVNKVETKVEANFNITFSNILSEEDKAQLFKTLKNKITGEGTIQVVCDDGRSQVKNKAEATQKLFQLINKGLIKPKKRKVTEIPKAVKEKRIADKKFTGEVKKLRKKPDV
ncbi:MAG: aminoacyl-tRNA hydrolase [Bacteroidetes bacterium]|nr:aminoacyl-tRNA hydrolase [Bacteroidota bacterium]MBP7398064.1 aminoacyl-tRNA hydrolase [Chitinophagales bacterium]MBK8487921.1 aminoacyl-tRNA hydrolase [Bacteroidota bacterium]MBK8682324.1 aminoacyl-tRNA hydrolase [Bacteroidota bacterium]MBP8753178.1 aminoacyl-tRNA hydrolase [Chitinophagales bacterium]